MRVLAMASQKGGSGKTTLSGHLAVQAQMSGAGPVCLIDIDPQGSLADWWNEREAECRPSPRPPSRGSPAISRSFASRLPPCRHRYPSCNTMAIQSVIAVAELLSSRLVRARTTFAPSVRRSIFAIAPANL